MKSSVIQSNVYVNDQVVNTIQDLEPYTLYVNPYFVITEFSNADKVSKHYYMGSQRVASELAVQSNNYSPLVNEQSTSGNATFTQESYNAEKSSGSTLGQILESPLQPKSANLWLNNLNEALTEFGKKTLTLEETQKELPTIESIYPDLSPQTNYKTASTQRVFYWYHPDYIGNVDLVTDLNGEAYELFLYNPWGENLYEWNSGTSSWSSPYRFNGKELDQETGLAYYGARYYANQLSMWLSVDPMALKGPNITPYSFSHNNSIILIDPDGNWPKWFDNAVSAVGNVFSNTWSTLTSVFIKKTEPYYDVLGEVKVTASAKVDIGVQAGVKTPFGSSKVNASSVELFSGGVDLTKREGYIDNTIGDEGAVVRQEISGNLKSPFKLPKDRNQSVGVSVGQVQRIIDINGWLENGGYFSSDYQTYGDASLIVPIIKSSPNESGPFVYSASGKATAGSDFAGIDIDIGATFILGVNINFKIGYNVQK